MNDLTEKTLATERKYTGRIISVDLLDIELPDGRKTKREVIRHGTTFTTALGCTDLTIITHDEETVLTERGKTVKVIPAWKWLLNR